MLIRADRLSSESTTYQRASGRSVWTNISSLAREYSSHFVSDCRSVGDSFQRRIGSVSRDSKRLYCSSAETENQYLRRMIPSSISIRSKIGHWRRKRTYSSGVQ